jgi:hypothetical protein
MSTVHVYTATPVARGLSNVFKVEVWKSGVEKPVATLWRRTLVEADSTGRRYERLLDGLR